MGKTVIIAEKPSVAADIAKALGGFRRCEDGWERDDAIVSNAIGHLVELALPEGEDRGYELPALPIIPPRFSLQPINKTASQLRLLAKLLKRSDVDQVVNACDAGREGELIFRYIYLITGCRKSMKRMWLQSMTPGAIKDAFASMRTGESMEPLFHAAQCRSEADWLIGINGTRALTKLHELKTRQRGTSNAGRVQTPTLAILVELENRIRTFVPKDYWEVHATFRAAAGKYVGKWFDPGFKKPDDEDSKADRLFDVQRAKAIEAKCAGVVPSSVKDESKPTSKAPPKLFDLTTLQRECNGKFGLSAKQTLDIAQALYQNHKVLTYPRTDAAALPEDYGDKTKEVLSSLKGTEYGEHAERVLSNDWVRPNDKRIFDNSKISDHFAIIPTGEQPSGLSDVEGKVYDLVVRRFVAAFHPAAEYLQTTRVTVVAGESFKSDGRVLLKEGWLAVYGKDASDDDVPKLTPVAAGEVPVNESVRAVGLKTKPPSRLTEATLLAAMENAGRLVDEDDLRDAMKDRGLGTPATRAATIEGLLSDRDSRGGPKEPYLRRDKKELVPQAKAMDLIAMLKENGIEALTSPRMTGDWEHKLLLMQQGKYGRAQFMAEIADMTRHIVDQIRRKAASIPIPAAEVLSAACPKCSGVVHDAGRTYACQSCDFKLWKEVAGRNLSSQEAETLLKDGHLPTLDGFVSKARKKFSAGLKLSAEKDKVEFVFEERDGGAGDGGTRKPRGEAIKDCPKCRGGKLFERSGPRGPFLGCSNYPKCKHLENLAA